MSLGTKTRNPTSAVFLKSFCESLSFDYVFIVLVLSFRIPKSQVNPP